MFDDIDEKLKVIAWIYFIFWCIIAIANLVSDPNDFIITLLGLESEGLFKFIMLIVTLFNGYVGSAILNGFAKIIEYTYTSANNSIRCMEKIERIEKILDDKR
jgi:hypothetical protein